MTVLCVSPHTDDELGAGGYIARLVEEGARVAVVALSDCRESVPAGFCPDVLRGEMRASADVLGIDIVSIESYPVRRFNEYRQDILEYLVQLRREISPDLVLCPALSDLHQDHALLSLECLRAFRCSIWGWSTPWNTLHSNVNGFVRLEDYHVELKIKAASKYESQAHRAYMDPDAIRAWARTTGLQAGTVFAESFEILRQVN